MKKIFIILLSFCFCISLVNIVHAAPAGWGIAIDEKTKECAGFWPGDEFTEYTLPEGWKAYFPDYSQKDARYDQECIKGKEKCAEKYQCNLFEIQQGKRVNEKTLSDCYEYENLCQSWCKGFSIIKTEIGQCYFQRSKEKSCCEQLGYAYVSDNIGKKNTIGLNRYQTSWTITIAGLILFVVIIILIIIIKKKRKSQTP